MSSYKKGTLSKIAGQAPIPLGKQYDRSKAKINFILGAPLGTDGDQEQGKATIAACADFYSSHIYPARTCVLFFAVPLLCAAPKRAGDEVALLL
jgi:hypothetical protein